MLKFVKKKICIQAKWPIRPALISGLSSMNELGIFLLPPGQNASPLLDYPPASNLPVPIYTPRCAEALSE